jgi:hypothetical protein
LVLLLGLDHIFFYATEVGADIPKDIILNNPPEKVELTDGGLYTIIIII